MRIVGGAHGYGLGHAARAWGDACHGCWAECEVIPNAIYSGDPARPWHPHVPRLEQQAPRSGARPGVRP